MRYLVKALDETRGFVAKGVEVLWAANDVRWVESTEIAFYQKHDDVFEVLGSTSTDGIADKGVVGLAHIDFNGIAEAAMTVTIGGIVYTEADTAAAASGVFTNGASADASSDSLIAAINGDMRTAVPFTAVPDASGAGIWIVYDTAGADGSVTVTTTSAGNCTVQAGKNGADQAIVNMCTFKHTVTTHELLSGALVLPLPFAPTTWFVNVYDTDGLKREDITDLITVDDEPDRLVITVDGATNIANTDVIHVAAFGKVAA